jgi:hypothetical protein
VDSSQLVGLPDHIRRRSAEADDVSEAYLLFSSAPARFDEGIWTQIALDVGRDDLSSDAVSWHEPLPYNRLGSHAVRDRNRGDGKDRKENESLESRLRG